VAGPSLAITDFALDIRLLQAVRSSPARRLRNISRVGLQGYRIGQQMMMKRRVPVCTINWCCPYRADLCTKNCTGEREPSDDYMLVSGDYVLIRNENGDHVRYFIPEKTKETFRRFDRGEEEVAGDYVFEAPRDGVSQPWRADGRLPVHRLLGEAPRPPPEAEGLRRGTAFNAVLNFRPS